MSDARTRILERLRQASGRAPYYANPTTEREAEWQARQPAIPDLVARFTEEQEKLGTRVLRVPDWGALPAAVTPWFGEYRIGSVMTGANPRLEPLREHLAAELGVALHRYDRPVEEQKEEIFSVDCGVTGAEGGIADTGSVVIIPSPEEPRLLSLAVPVHLVVVETRRLFPTLGAFLDSGRFQGSPPSNLVLISGASRTADIELTLAVGVHGPKVFLVALVG